MKAQINNEIGVKAYEGMRNDNKFMPPGVETWGFVEALSSFLAGDIAMTISWPPFGRWAAGYGVDDAALSWVPKSTIADKVGYALPPGGTPQLAAGFSLSVSSSSKNKEAAYLFIQWLNSEEISLQRVQLPYALRDPFRESHFTDKDYSRRWSDAPTTSRPCARAPTPACSIFRSCRSTSTRRPCGSRSPGSGPARTPRRSSTTWRRSGTA